MGRKRKQTLQDWAAGLEGATGCIVALGERSVKQRVVVVVEAHREAAKGYEIPVVVASDAFDVFELAESEAMNEGWGDDGCPTLRLTALHGAQLARGRSWQETRRPAELAPDVGEVGAVSALVQGMVRLVDRNTKAMEVLSATIQHREDALTEMLDKLVNARIDVLEAETDAVAAMLEQESNEGAADMGPIEALIEKLTPLVALAQAKQAQPLPA